MYFLIKSRLFGNSMVFAMLTAWLAITAVTLHHMTHPTMVASAGVQTVAQP
jgi:hypothetical protein